MNIFLYILYGSAFILFIYIMYGYFNKKTFVIPEKVDYKPPVYLWPWKVSYNHWPEWVLNGF